MSSVSLGNTTNSLLWQQLHPSQGVVMGVRVSFVRGWLVGHEKRLVSRAHNHGRPRAIPIPDVC